MSMNLNSKSQMAKFASTSPQPQDDSMINSNPVNRRMRGSLRAESAPVVTDGASQEMASLLQLSDPTPTFRVGESDEKTALLQTITAHMGNPIAGQVTQMVPPTTHVDLRSEAAGDAPPAERTAMAKQMKGNPTQHSFGMLGAMQNQNALPGAIKDIVRTANPGDQKKPSKDTSPKNGHPQVPKNTAAEVSLSELFDEVLKNLVPQNAKGKEEMQKILKSMVKDLGLKDTEVNKISQEVANGFKEAMKQFPVDKEPEKAFAKLLIKEFSKLSTSKVEAFKTLLSNFVDKDSVETVMNALEQDTNAESQVVDALTSLKGRGAGSSGNGWGPWIIGVCILLCCSGIKAQIDANKPVPTPRGEDRLEYNLRYLPGMEGGDREEQKQPHQESLLTKTAKVDDEKNNDHFHAV